MKVESCQKSRKNLDDFLAVTNFWGRAFQNLHQFYHPCLAARRLKKFREDNPTRPKVIDSNKLNFRANFKFSRLKLFGGPPSHLGCALASLGESQVHVKKLRAQHPIRAEM